MPRKTTILPHDPAGSVTVKRERAPRNRTGEKARLRAKKAAATNGGDDDEAIAPWSVNRGRLVGVLLGLVIGFVLARLFAKASGTSADLSDLKIVSGSIHEVDTNTRSLAEQFTKRDKVHVDKARELEADIAELTQRLDRMGPAAT